MTKCERVVKAFIKIIAGVKHRNAFFRKKVVKKISYNRKKISDIFNVEIVVGFMFTLLMKQFHSYGITPVNKFGAVFERHF